MHPPLVSAYLRWALLRAAFARGWWLATSLYLVVIAHLSPAQLILIGVFQGLTVVIAEVPAGVLADAVSRRLTLIGAHVVMGAGMAMTGFVTAFPLLVVSQCLWGLGWALASGADVAWITDELDRLDLIDGVLVAQGRWDLLGTPLGIVGFGALAWATTLSTAIIAAGLAMIGLGLVVVRWPESRLPLRDTDLRSRSTGIFRRGLAVARADRVILLVLAATLLVNGGAEGFGRLFARRLVLLGLPSQPDPIVWFAAVGLLAAALGAITLRYVEARVEGAGVAQRIYVAVCAVGVAGLVVFACAPNAASAVAGALLVSGIAFPTIRIASTILVNRRATSEARATIHSLLSQAENVGEIVFGLALAFIATSVSATAAFVASAVLVAGAGVVVWAAHDDAPRPDPIFADPRLAQIYDAVDDDRSDLDVYAALVDELGAETIVDIGCGTGVFACLLAQRGKNVIAIDPAHASLAVARHKPNAGAVRWLEGDASKAPAREADLVTMTGNVAQVFLSDSDWVSLLEAAWAALRGGGYLVFEVRNPARRAWETWTAATSKRELDIPGVGMVNTWLELTDVSLPYVSFRHTFAFEADGACLTSDSTLRFRERGEIVESLEEVGFVVREIRDAPDRPGLEWVFIAQRAAG